MGHTRLNALYHQIHLAVIISSIILSFLRMLHTKSFLLNTALGCSILLQGTWYFQSAFLVYKDGNIYWKLHKPEPFSEKLAIEQVVPMYLSAVFTWHLTGAAVTVLMVWTVMHFVINKMCIVSRRGSEWEAEQTECNENLIEEGLMAKNGRVDLEIDAEI